MIAFIDDHRGAYGVEPICKVLQIAPSTYYAHAARQADPELRSQRVKTDEILIPEVQRVWDDNYQVYGVRKVWRQLRRELPGAHRAQRAAELKAALQRRPTDPEQPLLPVFGVSHLSPDVLDALEWYCRERLKKPNLRHVSIAFSIAWACEAVSAVAWCKQDETAIAICARTADLLELHRMARPSVGRRAEPGLASEPSP